TSGQRDIQSRLTLFSKILLPVYRSLSDEVVQAIGNEKSITSEVRSGMLYVHCTSGQRDIQSRLNFKFKNTFHAYRSLNDEVGQANRNEKSSTSEVRAGMLYILENQQFHFNTIFIILNKEK
ncbi:MAG: hypothetical protein N4A41_00750, partial [Crocinitomicaceae bacterium]|nr:hypothetical protein [Crocinitomicaceae bacterium]